MLNSSQIVGIVNVTGDSFSEGRASTPENGVKRALQLLDGGADIVEFGAESTRPGAESISARQEMERLLPVLDDFCARYPAKRFAVDTRNSICARAALQRGACYAGDVSMLRHDPGMAATVAEFPEADMVICHSRGNPADMQDKKYQDYGKDIVETVMEELAAAAEKAVRAGVAKERIVFDPGFGFGKSVTQQLTMLREIRKFKKLGRIFAGVSRKSFLGAVAGIDDPAKRFAPTLVAEIHLAANGIDFIRTHEPEALVSAWKIHQELKVC